MTTIVTRAGKGSALTHNELDTNLTNLNSAKLEAADIAGKSDVGHTHTLANVSDVTISVANLNALDDGANTTLHFHDADRARANHTGTQALATISDVTITAANLNTLDDGVNTTLHFHNTDRDRANHTGTQAASTISDFNSATRTQVEAELIAGTNVTITPGGSGATRTLTIASSGGGAGALDDLSDVTITAPSNGQVLKYNGTTWINDTDATGGGGSVTVTGTPANNQLAVWTGSTELEGDSALTFDTATDTLAIGASGNLAFGAVVVLDDNSGTTTLQNIDAIDATTESTIESAIDTLPNLTSIQSRTVTLADAGADALFGWDDSASAYQNLSASDARTALGLTALATTTPGTNVATFLATPTSANLRAAITDEDGDGALLFANAPATLSTNTNLVRTTHGNRFLVCSTSSTHTVEDDTTGGWQTGDVLFGVNTSAGNVVLQGDGTATVTAEVGATLTVPAGRPWSLTRTTTNTWRGGAATSSGSGDVTKVGTPVNNQVGVWTGDGTLEGDTALTFDTATDTLTIAASGNLAFGAVTVLDDNSGTTTLSNIDAIDATTESTLEAALELDSLQGNLGVSHLNGGTGASASTYWRGDGSWATVSGSGDVSKVGTPANNQMAVWTGDGTLEGTSDFTYDGTSLNLITGKNFQIAGGTVLADSSGTLTLSGIDALDATTEATIESAIDTLPNLTSIQSQTFTLTGAFIRSGAHSLTLTTTGTTNVTLPTSGTLATTSQACGISAYIETPTAKTYRLLIKSRFAFTANEITVRTESGTCTVQATINGSNMTGGSQAASSTEASSTITAANSVAVGDDVEVVVSSVSSAVGLQINIGGTRTLA